MEVARYLVLVLGALLHLSFPLLMLYLVISLLRKSR